MVTKRRAAASRTLLSPEESILQRSVGGCEVLSIFRFQTVASGGIIDTWTGAIVSLHRVVRLALSARQPLGVLPLFVVSLTSLVWGQNQQVLTAPVEPAQVAKAISQPPQDPTPAPEPGPAASETTQLPTAAQIQAAAAHDRRQSDTAGTTTFGPLPVAPPQTTKLVGKGDAQPAIKPKYNVALIGQRNVGAGINFYSLDREIALGHQLSAGVEQSSRVVNDPIITEYVNRIGQNLVRNSDARVPFTIKVLEDEEVNAFALPGGFFYVDSGLILAADNEAELAGVMAHEIAHVAARHATKNMTKAQIWNMAQIPLMVVGGPVAYAISEVAGLAVPLGFLKFSRDAEREADLLGLEYDYATGYDPHAFVEFFEKLKLDEKHKHNAIAKAFSTHPMNSDRIKAAQEEIRNYLPDRPEYVVDTSEFEAIKARLYAMENAHRIGGPQDNRRPVLMRRTGGTDSSGGSNSGSDATGASDPHPADQDQPVLTRPHPSTSDSAKIPDGNDTWPKDPSATPAPAGPTNQN